MCKLTLCLLPCLSSVNPRLSLFDFSVLMQERRENIMKNSLQVFIPDIKFHVSSLKRTSRQTTKINRLTFSNMRLKLLLWIIRKHKIPSELIHMNVLNRDTNIQLSSLST